MIEVRPLKQSDIDACVSIVELNYNYRDSVQARKELRAMFDPDVWIRPEYFVIDNGQIVALGGYSLTSIDFETYGIFWINTHPEHRKKGYARRIVSKILEVVKEKQQQEKCGQVLISSEEALREFYESFGFKVIMETKAAANYIMVLNLF